MAQPLTPAAKPPRKVRSREPIPENETKAQKFQRIAKRRLISLLAEFDLFGSVFDTRSYEWTPEQFTKIKAHIEQKAGKVLHSGMHPSARAHVKQEVDF